MAELTACDRDWLACFFDPADWRISCTSMRDGEYRVTATAIDGRTIRGFATQQRRGTSPHEAALRLAREADHVIAVRAPLRIDPVEFEPPADDDVAELDYLTSERLVIARR
jgi:hypothetical protein